MKRREQRDENERLEQAVIDYARSLGWQPKPSISHFRPCLALALVGAGIACAVIGLLQAVWCPDGWPGMRLAFCGAVMILWGVGLIMWCIEVEEARHDQP